MSSAVTPHDVAMGLVRQRGTLLSDPGFIVAYLRAEQARDPLLGLTPKQVLQHRLQGLNEALMHIRAANHQVWSTLRSLDEVTTP